MLSTMRSTLGVFSCDFEVFPDIRRIFLQQRRPVRQWVRSAFELCHTENHHILFGGGVHCVAVCSLAWLMLVNRIGHLLMNVVSSY